MDKRFILHMLTTEKNLSPFDVVMALDAGWMSAVPYTNIKADEIRGLIQDAIFARSLKALKKIGIFIGGRNIKQAIQLLDLTKKSMRPPFEVSVLADPSGAYTLAASIVAFIEKKLEQAFNTQLGDKKIIILSGTCPVSLIAAILLANADSNVALISRDLQAARLAATFCNEQRVSDKPHIVAASADDKASLLKDADVVLTTAVSGIQLLSKQLLMRAERLKICVDVNPIPPYGIEGINPNQHDQIIPCCNHKAVAIGALALGDIKYNVQHLLLKQLTQSEQPVFLSYEHAYATAKNYLTEFSKYSS